MEDYEITDDEIIEDFMDTIERQGMRIAELEIVIDRLQLNSFSLQQIITNARED